MEIHGRHDIFRASGLLLSVHIMFIFVVVFFFCLYRPQLSLSAGLSAAPRVMLPLFTSSNCSYVACLAGCVVPGCLSLHFVITFLCR